jgi:transposase
VIALTPRLRVWVAAEPADFRCGIDGLARRVRQVLAEDPFSGALFVFRNRRHTAVKLLVYDGQGFWLCEKRLSQGRFRFWPRRVAGAGPRPARPGGAALGRRLCGGRGDAALAGNRLTLAFQSGIRYNGLRVHDPLHRGRTVTTDDLETIRALLKAHPDASRRAFSQRLCEHWDWRQPNGALRDMVCRSLLLVLHRAEHICLPAVRHRPPNNAIARRRPTAGGRGPLAAGSRLDALRPSNWWRFAARRWKDSSIT